MTGAIEFYLYGNGDFMDRREYEKRKIMPGFPKEGKFKTMAEVEAYISGEKIQCLLCGKWFKLLGATHLNRIHEITLDDYRERYGIPWKAGLAGKSTRKKYSIKAKIQLAEGQLRSPVKGEPFPTKKRSIIRKAPPCIRDRMKKWRRDDYEAVPERMRERKCTIREVCLDPDLPNYDAWMTYAKTHPELREKARQIHFTLPLSEQFKIRDVSPAFQEDCHLLRTKGMSLVRIGAALGASAMSVQRALHALYKKTGQTEIPREKESDGPRLARLRHKKKRWGRKDYEAILDRMREQHRTFPDVCVNDPDLPGVHAWRCFAKENPEFKAKLQAVYLRMPYSVQVRVQGVSARFSVDCERLRARGLRHAAISIALGVPESVVERFLQDFDRRTGIFDRMPRKIWAPGDFEAILNRIREQQRTLNDVCSDPDLPSSDEWRGYVKKHPEMAVKLQEIYHSLPYSFQARTGALSPSFGVECRRMRALGASNREISEILGVGRNTVGSQVRGVARGRASKTRGKSK